MEKSSLANTIHNSSLAYLETLYAIFKKYRKFKTLFQIDRLS